MLGHSHCYKIPAAQQSWIFLAGFFVSCRLKGFQLVHIVGRSVQHLDSSTTTTSLQDVFQKEPG